MIELQLKLGVNNIIQQVESVLTAVELLKQFKNYKSINIIKSLKL